ncbi:uncharacterized protein LOC108022172 [Drosophila biarmipes]|uniref:uncharacterized protein LOC108022172 n=1 Tax=Drosophila biarmipes TaxID=125945 RepID=UPI0007E821BA|nr:uncharacterized protein LOC108022172 [Drosophila biarmipes]
MTTKSDVLTIGTETSETLDERRIPKSPKELQDSDLEKYLQKILLNSAKPLTNVYLDGSVERFSANENRKNGQYTYEFGPSDKINGWMISCPTFEPKGVLKRVKDKISKQHWISENVAKYPKDSRDFIMETVSKAVDEEYSDIYDYLTYLNEHNK